MKTKQLPQAITKMTVNMAGMTLKEFASKMRMSYGVLNQRMNGYLNWQGNELYRAAEILKAAKK